MTNIITITISTNQLKLDKVVISAVKRFHCAIQFIDEDVTCKITFYQKTSVLFFRLTLQKKNCIRYA